MRTATIDEISTVLQKRIYNLSLGGLGADFSGVKFPNKSVERTKPYLVMEPVYGPKKNPGLAAGGKVRMGYMVVKVIEDKGKHLTVANGIAEAIENLFPMGLELDCGTAKLRLDKDAQVQMGYETESSYCIPVHIHYVLTGK